MELRTKLCPYVCTINSKTVTGRNLSGLSVGDGVVLVKIIPYDFLIGGSVSVRMMKEENVGDGGIYCYKSAFHHIRWYRRKFEFYPVIIHTLPNSCRLVGYEILSFGTDESGDGREITHSWIHSADGDINDPDGILQYDLDMEYVRTQTQNRIVPGEDVVLHTWLRPTTGEVKKLWSGHVWWGTNCISGGKVKAINGDYGNEDITYTVNIMGTDRTVVSSDFVEYAVDDWVFVMNVDSIGHCEWEEDDGWIDETGISEQVGEGWVIIPIKISSYGA